MAFNQIATKNSQGFLFAPGACPAQREAHLASSERRGTRHPWPRLAWSIRVLVALGSGLQLTRLSGLPTCSTLSPSCRGGTMGTPDKKDTSLRRHQGMLASGDQHAALGISRTQTLGNPYLKCTQCTLHPDLDRPCTLYLSWSAVSIATRRPHVCAIWMPTRVYPPSCEMGLHFSASAAPAHEQPSLHQQQLSSTALDAKTIACRAISSGSPALRSAFASEYWIAL